MPKKVKATDKGVMALQKISNYAGRQYFALPHRLVSDSKKYKETFDRLVQPHWNQMVGLLNEQGGYGELLTLRSRIQERFDTAEEQHNKSEKILHGYQMALDLLISESKYHGPDNILRNTLGHDKLINSKPKYWTWGVVYMSDEPFDDLQKSDHFYSPRVTDLYKSFFAADAFPEYLYPIKGSKTWREMIEETKTSLKLYSDKDENLEGLIDILRLRLNVLHAVLHEYELLGKAEKYQLIAEKEVKADPVEKFEQESQAVMMIRFGLKIYDKSPKDFKNRTALLLKIADEFKYDSSNGVKKVLIRAGLYQTGTEGSPELHLRGPLLSEMVELWRSHLKKTK